VEHLLPTLLGVVIGSAVPWPLKALWRQLRGSAQLAENEVGRLTRRIGDLEDLVDLLRKALDKHLIRESAIASACELLIALAKSVSKPSGAMLHIRDRAEQLLIDAQARIGTINREPRP
jgi:hypothetical protein